MSDRSIACDTVGRGGKYYVVSTVRLAFDHGHLGSPLWFETMVFPGSKDGEVVDWCEVHGVRYETKTQAQDGHHDVVKNWGLN